MEPIYFSSAREFRDWLAEHHATATELQVGYFKRGTGRPSMTWPESVDEALCVGWIDGVRRRIDDERYTIRFTPRRRGSNWSEVNVARVAALTAEGRMQPAGLAAFAARKPAVSGAYTYERPPADLPEPYARHFRERDEAAWRFFVTWPPSHRRTAIGWVLDAKREETRMRRLDQVIAASAGGRRWGDAAAPRAEAG